jgi:hypothetical protein
VNVNCVPVLNPPNTNVSKNTNRYSLVETILPVRSSDALESIHFHTIQDRSFSESRFDLFFILVNVFFVVNQVVK